MDVVRMEGPLASIHNRFYRLQNDSSDLVSILEQSLNIWVDQKVFLPAAAASLTTRADEAAG